MKLFEVTKGLCKLLEDLPGVVVEGWEYHRDTGQSQDRIDVKMLHGSDILVVYFNQGSELVDWGEVEVVYGDFFISTRVKLSFHEFDPDDVFWLGYLILVIRDAV